MFLLFLGLVIAAIGFVVSRSNPRSATPGRIAMVVGVVLGVTGFITSSIVIVEPGSVKVKKLFGTINNTPLEAGLHIVNPFASLTEYSIQVQNFTMASTGGEASQGEGEAPIQVLTADGLQVVIDVSILYHLQASKTPSIQAEIGPNYRDKIVRPLSRTKIRDNAVYYDAISLYSTKRDEFQARIFNSIKDDFNKRGIELEQILIRNINLPESVKLTIESKINAEQDAQKMEFVLQKAKQEADVKRVEAQGIADYNRIISQGLTDKQLQYETIRASKELALSPNSKVIVLGGGKNTPIMLSGN
jgi:regulator of protease activity HflC (stomatin/prohibitin superfamily)